MIGFIAYQTLQAMNLHFSDKSSYDFFTYNGKTNSSANSFNSNLFKYQYINLEKSSNNIVFHYYLLFREIDFAYCKPTYAMFKKIRSLSKGFELDPYGFLYPIIKNDLEVLRSHFEDDLTSIGNNNQYEPELITIYNNGKISIETLLLIDSYIVNVLQLKNCHDIVSWPKLLKKMNKVRPFVEQMIDKETFSNLFLNHFLSNK